MSSVDDKWSLFVAELVDHWPHASPEDAASILIGFARKHHVTGSPLTVEDIAKTLGILVVRGAESVNPQHAALHRCTSKEQGSASGVIELGQGLKPGRRSFLIAHEIGHWVLDRVFENTQLSNEDTIKQWASPIAQHEFARGFAGALMEPLLPEVPTELQEVEQRLSNTAIDWVAAWRAEGGPAMTFYHLVEIARVERLSIRHVISRLRGTSLLAKTKTAILVYRQMTNQFTLQEKGIRLWQSAMPPWGFVPKNQRAWRHGMTGLLDVYLTGKHFTTAFHTESQLHVKERNTVPEGRQFTEKTLLEVRCATTPVDVSSEGRFLVTMFTWPTPDGWSEITTSDSDEGNLQGHVPETEF